MRVSQLNKLEAVYEALKSFEQYMPRLELKVGDYYSYAVKKYAGVHIF